MTTHNIEIVPSLSLSTVIVCRGCTNPEPVTNEHTWRDSNNDVYFDSIGADALFVFLIHHDAFKLSELFSANHELWGARVAAKCGPDCTPECAAHNHMLSPL
jgi:hypothetical protein